MNTTKPKITKSSSKQSHCLTKKNKYSISIYSNPYNVSIPFINKPKHSNISSIYKKIASKAILDNSKTKKHEHKLTMTNIINILRTTSTNVNNKTNQTLLQKKKSFQISRIETSKEKNKSINKLVKGNAVKKEETKPKQRMKNQKSFSISINDIIRSNRNLVDKFKKSHHERSTSFSTRNIIINKNIKAKKNPIENKHTKNENKSKKVIIPYQQKDLKQILTKVNIHKTRQQKRDTSSSKKKTTDATPYSTVQKDSFINNSKKEEISIENSLFIDISNDNEEEDPFNDINTIIRRIDYTDQEDLNIFDVENNKEYDIFSEGFIEKFEKKYTLE